MSMKPFKSDYRDLKKNNFLFLLEKVYQQDCLKTSKIVNILDSISIMKYHDIDIKDAVIDSLYKPQLR